MAFTETFVEVALEKAYELLSGARTIMVCTKGAKDGQYNVTPYGWFTTYDYEPVSKMLFVSDPSHQAAANVLRTKEFAVCVPENEDDPLIAQAGSVSSPDADKFALFSITGERATKIDAKVIPGMSRAIIEFKLARVVEEGSVKIFMGEAVAAWKRA